MASISDEYSSLGDPKGNILQGISVIDPREKDPVELCLPGKYMNSSALTNIDNGMCPKFMVQRCANKWDKYCNIYINESLKGSKLDQELFVDQVTDGRFCKLDPTYVGGSNCKILQQLFDPTMPNSPLLTTTIGDIVYSEAPLSGYQIIQGCPKKCDVVDKDIESDPLFKRCLVNSEKDPCRSVIDNVCKLSTEKKFDIKGDKLKEICNSRIKNLNILENSIPVRNGEKTATITEGFAGKAAGFGVFVSIAVIAAVIVLYLKMRHRR